MPMEAAPASASPRAAIPWHRNPRARALVFQVAAALLLAWFLYRIAANTVSNMAERGITVGLDFMGQVAPFGIGFAPLWEYELGVSKYWEVLVIGTQNTILVSALGVVAATLLGFVVGVLRLSPNWLVRKMASAYVEVMRNIPLPLWIFFWYVAVFLPVLPPPRDSIAMGGGVFLNKEGLYTPKPLVDDPTAATVFFLLLLALVAGLLFLRRWAQRRQDMTGQPFPLFAVSAAALLAAPVLLFYLLGQPFHLEYPEMGKFVMTGGVNFNLSFFVLWFVLTVYTSAYIGENVRAGILAVARGQSEAAHSLGLRRTPTLHLVVIPQAMRVIVPPTISQFLNLTKNSSLAVIVAYEDIVNVFAGIALNQTGQALPIIAITILLYGTLSLLTSAVLNWYNKRVQLTER